MKWTLPPFKRKVLQKRGWNIAMAMVLLPVLLIITYKLSAARKQRK